MNGPASNILTQAAVMRGELRSTLLAIGIVLLILLAIVAVEKILDRFRPATGMWPRIAIALLLAIGIGLAGIRLAGARDLDGRYAQSRDLDH